MTPEIVKALLEPLPSGLPSVSQYNDFRRITGMADTPDSFVAWAQAAVTLMQKTDRAH